MSDEPNAPAYIPRVFSIGGLVPRANSATSRSARVANSETVGANRLFSGVFWSDSGSEGGWSFGSSDPGIPGCPYTGDGEEVYLCLAGRIAVEWSGGSFEFGAGDIVFFPNGQWYRTRVISEEPVQVFYVMAPPPTSIWSVFEPVTTTGAPVQPED